MTDKQGGQGRARTNYPRYFHGGYPRLNVGQWVLPPAVTKTRRNLSDFVAADEADYAKRRDLVYVTTSQAAAVLYGGMYAATFGSAAIYEVAPAGTLEADPDCSEPGLSWCCPKARVWAKRMVTKREMDLALSVLMEAGHAG